MTGKAYQIMVVEAVPCRINGANVQNGRYSICSAVCPSMIALISGGERLVPRDSRFRGGEPHST